MGRATTPTTSSGPSGTSDGATRPPDRGVDDRIAGPSAAAWPRGRRIAFRVLAVLVSLWVLAYLLFALMEVVIMWLPDEILLTDFEQTAPGGLPIHRSHFMADGLIAWSIVPAVLVQLRKPWRRVAPMLQAVVLGLAAAIAFGLSGTLAAWITEDLVITIPIVVLAALHPRAGDLLRRPVLDHDMSRWAVIAAVPWTVYALVQARLQYLDLPGDPHAGVEHWGTGFMLAVAVIACAVVGATNHEGWRMSAWTAAIVSIVFGVHSLVFPGLASGLPLVAALGAVAWGVTYGLALVRRSRDQKGTRAGT